MLRSAICLVAIVVLNQESLQRRAMDVLVIEASRDKSDWGEAFLENVDSVVVEKTSRSMKIFKGNFPKATSRPHKMRRGLHGFF